MYKNKNDDTNGGGRERAFAIDMWRYYLEAELLSNYLHGHYVRVLSLFTAAMCIARRLLIRLENVFDGGAVDVTAGDPRTRKS